MSLRKGTRVKHPARPEWGVGQVIEEGSSTSVRVFFEGAGLKVLLPSAVKLETITGTAAKSVVLDNLSPKALDPNARYVSVAQAIQRFMELFPQGFYGKRYFAEERNYKDRARRMAQELLNPTRLREVIKESRHDEAYRDALRVVNATNLIFPNEKMALKDGVEAKAAQKKFVQRLYGVLETPQLGEEAFKAFANVLEEVGAAKWTIASYFTYLVYPEHHMFVKPSITQKAAELSAFDLNYKPELNWLTYARVLEFAHRLRNDLAELKPRDMIDVQSFMWCIAPEI